MLKEKRLAKKKWDTERTKESRQEQEQHGDYYRHVLRRYGEYIEGC